MSNPDNIAKQLADAQQKSTDQQTQEQIEAARTNQNAQVDKVSAVEQKPTDGDEGLTGAGRDVAPATTPERTRDVKFAPIVASAVATINDYELKMGSNVSVNAEIIDSQQVRLYHAIRAIVTVEDNSEFMGGMEFLFRKFLEDKNGAFNGSTVRRRLSFMRQISAEQAFKSYTGFLGLLEAFADPKGRKVQWARFNKRQALDFLNPNQQLRQRLETYMSRICS